MKSHRPAPFAVSYVDRIRADGFNLPICAWYLAHMFAPEPIGNLDRAARSHRRIWTGIVPNLNTIGDCPGIRLFAFGEHVLKMDFSDVAAKWTVIFPHHRTQDDPNPGQNQKRSTELEIVSSKHSIESCLLEMRTAIKIPCEMVFDIIPLSQQLSESVRSLQFDLQLD